MIVLSLLKAGPRKPNIWIEAGIHAREWIAPAMATYIIDQLLHNAQDGFLDELNFHILPIANPDGYEFTRPPMDEDVENVSNVYAEKMFYTMVHTTHGCTTYLTK